MKMRETTNAQTELYSRKKPPKEKPPAMNRTGRIWRPNQCPEVVLKCGAVETSWLEFRKDGKNWQHCPIHNVLEEIVRDATITDKLEWREKRWQETTLL